MSKKEYINYQSKEILHIHELSKLDDMKLLKYRPDLWEIWDFEKNNNEGSSIYDVHKLSSKHFWVKCKNCNISFTKRCFELMSNRECHNCKLLKNRYPNIFNQLHKVKNKNINLDKLTYGSRIEVWWTGECGHEWKRQVKRRTTYNEGCIYCNGNKNILKGFNDMWTTNPEDGYKYMQTSNKYTDWKCKCGCIIKNKRISTTKNYGLPCSRCSDGFSFAEKLMSSVLTQVGLEFIIEKSFKWSDRKRYDFYIPSLNCIIEMHGNQHYDAIFHRGVTRNLEQEKINDYYKNKLAIENGIDIYIVINSKVSELEYIKSNILSSELSTILDLSMVDWNIALKETSNSYMIKCLNYWNSGIKSVPEITKISGLSESTVRKYLKTLTILGLCDYYTKMDLEKLKK